MSPNAQTHIPNGAGDKQLGSNTNAKYLHLTPEHVAMLVASRISPEVAKARGYRSISTKAELKRLGYADTQLIVPTLFIPIWDVHGEMSLHHARPNEPRMRDGKPVKYEFPAGKHMVIDVHPSIRDKVRNPTIPLFITEGAKKADAAISQGLCCTAIIGVWNWRGSNEYGGKTALPDWDSIALKDKHDKPRQVYIAYDSDVMLKRPVYQGMSRLAALLKSRGANVAFIYLPPSEDARKTGLDDYLAAGHTVADLLALATSELRNPELADTDKHSDLPYKETEYGLVWLQTTRDGVVEKPLTNYTARIVAETIEDDGVETSLCFDIEAKCNGREYRFQVGASAFVAMNWPIEQMGAAALTWPGMGTKDNARAAIQMFSGRPQRKHVYRMTGWGKDENGHYVYRHAGGAIGAQSDSGADGVRLPEALSSYLLPEPPQGDELTDAITASLRLLELAPDHVSVPLLAATYRAALDTADFSVFLAGPSGVFKSEGAALMQQHYGAGMDARHLPANWSSTENALEGQAFACMHALMVADDYVPLGGGRDIERLHAKADRLLRAQGNNSGRQRMRADGSLRPSKPPRGTILSTGEDIPPGHSLRGRMAILELSRGDIAADALTLCQRDAAAGKYAASMAAFIAWLAPNYEDRRAAWRSRIVQLRTEAAQVGGLHSRTPEITANLGAGIGLFIRFAREAGVLEATDAGKLWARCWSALNKAASLQAQHQAASEPAGRFLELVASAIASGRAHIEDWTNRTPAEPRTWGWQPVQRGSGEFGYTEWQPLGARIGWLDTEAKPPALYLIPDEAYNVARQHGSTGGEGLTVTSRTLWKRLNERGFLQSTDTVRGTLYIRRTRDTTVYNVLHLQPASIMPKETDISAISDIPPFEDAGPRTEAAQDGRKAVSVYQGGTKETDINSSPQTDIPRTNAGPNGRNGRNGSLSEGYTAYSNGATPTLDVSGADEQAEQIVEVEI